MIEETIQFISEHVRKAKRPALLCSFGKDSMTLAELIRRAYSSVSFPIDVIYHRDPWFPHKHEFAEHTARSWGMTVHDYPPMHAGVKVKDDMIELVARYNFGTSVLDIPKNTTPPIARRNFVCGLNDWLLRPKCVVGTYPWDLVFHGHKSSDNDPFEGAVPLKTDITKIGGVRVAFPLRDWTDNDVWEFIEENHVPIPENRYENRMDREDTWFNNDHIHACCACIDPRVKEKTVFCPKVKREVENVGSRVLQLRADTPYIERQATYG
jgi:hypothetical protein